MREGMASSYGSEKLLVNENVTSLLSSRPLLRIFSYLLQSLVQTSVFFLCNNYKQSV